jgi:hypothetical protein
VKTDQTISAFTDDVEQNPPDEDLLFRSKIDFQRSLLHELFNFKSIRYHFNNLKKEILLNKNIIDASIIKEVTGIDETIEKEIFVIADKFKVQLDYYFTITNLPEEIPELQERVKKASVYFSEKQESLLHLFTKNILIETDNKAVNKVLNELLEKLQKSAFIKISCLKNSIDGFKTDKYIRARSDSDLDYTPQLKTVQKHKSSVAANIPHPDLYAELKAWRNEKAAELDITEYLILPYKTMIELVKFLPVTLSELNTIRGLGKRKVKLFGEEIINIILEYCLQHKIKRPLIEIKPKSGKVKKAKTDSKKISFDLFKAGKTISQIAEERNFAVSTIENHIAHYIDSGELNILDFVSKEKADVIADLINDNQNLSITEIRNALGKNYSYSEIRLIMNHIENSN